MKLQLAIMGYDREFETGETGSGQYAAPAAELDAAGEPVQTPSKKAPVAHVSLGLPPNTVRIAASAFADCDELASVAAPSSLRVIEEKAFERCSSLELFAFSGELEYLGARAFQHCGFKSFAFPAGVFSAPERVLYGCTHLTHLELGKCISRIEDSAFARCTSLAQVDGLEWVSEIGRRAFSACRSLRNVTFSDAIRVIESEAFIGCAHLRELVIPSCIEVIGSRAFAGCNELKMEMLDPSLIQRFPEAFTR